MSYQFQSIYLKISEQFETKILGKGYKNRQIDDETRQELSKIKKDCRILRLQFTNELNFDQEECIDALRECLNKCSKIDSIELMFDNNITKPQQIKGLMGVLCECCPRIKELSFYSKSKALNKVFVDSLFGYLSSFEDLQSVKLMFMTNVGSVPKAMGKYLNQVQNLQRLDIYASEICQASSVDLFKELCNIKSLRYVKVDYSQNCISLSGSIALAQMIQQLPQLNTLLLNLQRTKISQQATQAIGQALQNTTQLQHLMIDLSYNQFINDYLFEFAQSLQRLNKIHRLELFMKDSYFDLKTSKAFVQSISAMTKLDYLQFHYTNSSKITSENHYFDCKSFSNVFQSLPHLLHLDIQISPSTFVPILLSLKYCEFIQCLKFNVDLSAENQLKQEYSPQKINKALENLQNIQSITYIIMNYYYSIDQEMAVQVAQSVQNLHSTQYLGIIFSHTYFPHLNSDILRNIQNIFIENVQLLKDTLNHIDLQIYKFQYDDTVLETLNQIRNLYSAKINLLRTGAFFDAINGIEKPKKNYELLKLSRLVNQSIEYFL